jgi:membrane protein DedA with SNARE-associated domain
VGARFYGFLPGLAVVVVGWLLGASAETLSANPIVWIVVAVLIGALVAEWVIRHKRRTASADGA